MIICIAVITQLMFYMHTCARESRSRWEFEMRCAAPWGALGWADLLWKEREIRN